MTSADSNTQSVEQRSHIQMMDIAHIERYNGILIVNGRTADHRTVDMHAINRLQLLPEAYDFKKILNW